MSTAIISRIGVLLSADVGDALRPMGDVAAGLERIGELADRVNSSLSSVRMPDVSGGPGGGGGGASAAGADLAASVVPQMAAVGQQIAASLTGALAPVGPMFQRFAGQFDRTAGAMVTTMRRIDASMKMPGKEKFAVDTEVALNKIAAALRTANAAALKANGFPRLGNAILAVSARMSQLAADTTRETMTVYKLYSWFSSLGDVARKPLSALKGIANLTFGKPEAGISRIAAALPGLTASVNRLRGSMGGLWSQVAMGVGAYALVSRGVSSFVGSTLDGIKGAANLNETLSKTDVILGSAAPTVRAYADTVAERFGIVKQVTLDAAAGFAGLGKGIGKLAGDNLGRFSKDMTQLSADLMSFANIDMGQASQAIMTGLAGEQSDTLKKLGIVLKEETIEQYALAHGIIKANQELTEQGKVAVRAAVIAEGLKDAQGDLARTQDSTANQFRKFQGAMENWANDFGQVLLPAVARGTAALTELMTAGSATSGVLVDSMSWLANKTAEALETAAFASRNFGAIWEIVVLKFREAGANVLLWIGTIPENLSILANYIGNNWYKLLKDHLNRVAMLWKNLAVNIWSFGEAIGTFLADPTQGFQFNWTPMLEGFKATADKLPEFIRPGLISVQKEIDARLEQIGRDEVARAKQIRKEVAGPALDPLSLFGKGGLAQDDKSKKKKDKQFADLAEMGSKESYSAIIRHQRGGTDDVQKKQLDAQQKTAVATQAIAAKFAAGAGVGVGVVAFSIPR